MIVSLRHGFVWLHNPKVAGTSFRTSIAAYHDWPVEFFWFSEHRGRTVDMAHLPLWLLREVAPDLWRQWLNFRTVVFVRDPLRRFISACSEHYNNFDSPKKFRAATSIARQQVATASVMERLNPELIRLDYRYAHFTPQRDYIFLGADRMTQHVLPISNLAAGYDALGIPRAPVLELNRNRPELFGHVITREVVDFVHRFYAADYAMLEAVCPAAIEPEPDAPSRSLRVMGEVLARRLARKVLG